LSVRPEAAARAFASESSWSSILMVVRMHQSINVYHQDVKRRLSGASSAHPAATCAGAR
jgi:hypothetical protein